MGKYKTFGSRFDRVHRNDLNANFAAVEADINAQKTRVDGLIKGTPQPSEVVDARGGFPVLRDRFEDLSSSVAQNTAKVYVESSKKLGSETDDTARIQRAIDSAEEYSEIIFDTKKEYNFSNVVSTKSLTINFNGAKLIVNPSVTNKPAVHFKGAVGTQQNILANVVEKDITISVSGASNLFERNDYIIIGDNKAVSSWNGSGFNYNGQSEINIVTNVSGDTITLAKPVEWNYNLSDSAYVQKITTLLKNPKVLNVGHLTEIDPQTTSASANAGNGHLFQFEYCVLPKVENFTIEGWQLHAVNFYRCIHGLANTGQCYNPFRPQDGGHGYVVKYDNSWGGVAKEITAHYARHVIDWSKSYDGISQDNFSYFPYGVSFYTHGLGSKRIKSKDDTVMGAGSASEGWAMGNPSFTADYDYQIINPTYRGEGIGIGMKTLSKNMKVINPNIVTKNKYAISVSRGAEDFSMYGGEIENYQPAPGVNYYAVLARANANDGDPVVAEAKNVTIRGTKIKGNAIVYVDVLGSIVIDDLECDLTITPNGGLSGGIRVSPSVTPTDISIRRNRISGSFDRGIYLSTAPTRYYRVEGNMVDGYTTTGIQIRAASNLRLLDNTVKGSGNEFGFSGVIATEITNGAVLSGNTPNNTARKGIATFNGDGTTKAFAIPHGLIAQPSFYTVKEGNADTGTATLNYVVANSTNITVSFKTAPIAGTNNVVLNWKAEV